MTLLPRGTTAPRRRTPSRVGRQMGAVLLLMVPLLGAAPAPTLVEADRVPPAPSTANASVVPATSVTGLVRPAAAQGAVPAIVAPDARRRLIERQRAGQALARAVDGARHGFSRPVEGTHMTSPFGRRWGRLHAGVDFAGPIGQAVRAVTAGTVTVAGPAGGYGRLIEIRHPDGSFTRYGHLHRIDVSVGDTVRAADVIGALGNAGRSTGPHLHLELRTPASAPVDPLPWLRSRGIVPVETPPED